MSRKLIGQINLEFLTAAILYLIAVGGIFFAGGDILPSYHSEMDRMSLNLEADTFTYELLSHPGSHSYGDGGDNWEENSSTIENAESLGLANSYFQVERDKINSLADGSLPPGEDEENLEYNEFLEIKDIEHQYHFEFTWLPIVHTPDSFTRGDPPENPEIEEPCEEDIEAECLSGYNQADDEVNYGSISLEGRSYNFLVTAENGVYNQVYVSDTWSFDDEAYSQQDSFSLLDRDYTIESFQNREDEEGSVVILSKYLNQFGPSPDSDVSVQRIERYAVMEDQPLRMEVWVW